MPDKKFDFLFRKKEDLKYNKLFLLIIIILFFLAVLQFGFPDALTRLISRYDTGLKTEPQTPPEEPPEERTGAEIDLAKGPDWWIVYFVPTCFQKPNAETYDEMGAARIHFVKGKSGEITGVSFSGDTNIRFRGTFDGRNLEIDDNGFFKNDNPIKSSLVLSDGAKEMSGTYKAILGSDAVYIGCATGEEIRGKATASTCKNLDGQGCP